MPIMRPIRHLKDTGKISQYVKDANEPVFITKNGYADMVMMNMEVFERLVGTVYIKKNQENKEDAMYIAENND